MKREKPIPPGTLERSIEWAKHLVEDHLDPTAAVGERLHEIGRKLNVSRIEAGAVRTSGFLTRLSDGTFAVYYASDCGVARRRFTVAHELAHLVLEKFYKHVGRDQCNSGWDGHPPAVEAAVDRIASELLMPEAMVVGLMKTQCQLERGQSAVGLVRKRAVLQSVGQSLGVSEKALVHRLLQLPCLLSVLLRVQWNKKVGPARVSHLAEKHSQHSYLRIVHGLCPNISDREHQDCWGHQVHVQTKWGLRIIHCHGWHRPDRTLPNEVETWILGWAWNAFPLPAWDDSEQKGGTPDVLRIREFETRRSQEKKRRVGSGISSSGKGVRAVLDK